MTGTHVVFRTAGHRFALPIEEVRKVRPLARTTRVPGTSPVVAGAMNDEGAIVTVLDLAVRLGAAPTIEGDRWVVMLAPPHAGLGLLVEEVEDVVPLEATDEAADRPEAIAALVGPALHAVAPPPRTEADADPDERDDAAWLRHTLTESARLMGFRAFGPSGSTLQTDLVGEHRLQWRLDLQKVLAGGGP